MPEVPMENAQETIEHHAHGSTEAWIMGVALTAAILAALAAVTALLAEHHFTHAMVLNIEANDAWGEFQTNSVKEKVIETKAALLAGRENQPDKKDADALKKYAEKKDESMNEAKKLKKESARHLEQHMPLALGLTMFQVAIAIGAISVLIKRKVFWFVSIGFGVIGLGFLIWGLVL